MYKPTKYERLITCPECMGDASEWDEHLNDYIIKCEKCVGDGQICGECYLNIESCPGEGICWEHGENELFDSEEH